MPSVFDRSTPGLLVGTNRTLLYGPVQPGTTVVVFAGTFANVDTVGQGEQYITLETLNGATYTQLLYQVPLKFGSSSKCPTIVMLPGESLYGTASAANSVAAQLNFLIRT